MRRFAPGSPITYSFTVFHPNAARQEVADVRAQAFRDGLAVWSGSPHALEAGKPEATVVRDLRFGPDTPEGAYIPRIVARNRSDDKIVSTAAEWVDFELSEAARQ